MNEHIDILHQGLTEFMADRAFDIGRGCLISSGLLPPRAQHGMLPIKTRLLVASGVFDAIQGVLPYDLPPTQDLLAAGLLESRPLDIRFTHLGIVSRGLALDLLNKTSPLNSMEQKDVLKVSHSIRVAGPSDLTAESAEMLFQKIMAQAIE